MTETLLAHCPLCRQTVRVPIRSRQVAIDRDGHPIVAFKAAPVDHRCQTPKEPT